MYDQDNHDEVFGGAASGGDGAQNTNPQADAENGYSSAGGSTYNTESSSPCGSADAGSTASADGESSEYRFKRDDIPHPSYMDANYVPHEETQSGPRSYYTPPVTPPPKAPKAKKEKKPRKPVNPMVKWIAAAILGGIGGVLVFLPQIALLFAMIALLEGVGYMSRAAFLMDRVMARFGLEGRAFVALLSAFACAIPGIMATRSLPSARDRLATMMAAPIMTCSARLPVYVMLIALLVPAEARIGPIGAQGAAMFALYVLGAVAAMLTAWVFGRLGGRRQRALPFYMEMPPYRLPRARAVAMAVWDASRSFVKKVATIILTTTIALWVLLSFPLHDATRLAEAGVDPADEVAVAAYTLDHSYAAALGRAAQPVFEPLGFDWRVNVGVIASLTAREVFVSTMGQIAAAEDPENPGEALAAMTVADGPRAGEPLFTPPVLASLVVFFMFALQCFATIGVLRRETGGWKWPLIAFGYMFALAWTGAFVAGRAVALLLP